MSTSGSYNYNQNRDQIVRSAFEIIDFISPVDSLDPEDIGMGVKMLNLMIRTWEADGVYLWANEEGIVFFTPSTYKYTLGPTGDHATDISTYVRTTLSADHASNATTINVASTTSMTIGDHIGIELSTGSLHWTTIATIPTSISLTISSGLSTSALSGGVVYTYTNKIQKPLKIISARRRSLGDSDSQVTEYAREDYMALSNKTSSGTVSMYYYQPLTTTGHIYLYQAPNTCREVLHITYVRPVQDFDNSTDDPDFPSQWTETIIWNLALRLCIPYGKSGKAQEIQPFAQEMYDTLSSYSYDNSNLMLQPRLDW